MDGERFDGYGRLYAGSAPLFIALSFLPVLEPIRAGEAGARYGSLWDMIHQPDSGHAVRGVVLLLVLLAFLVAGAFRPDAQLVPSGIAVTAAVLATRVLTRSGIPQPKPDLADAGTAGAALAIATAIVALVHLWHLALLRQRRAAAIQR